MVSDGRFMNNFFKGFNIYSIKSKLTICFLALGLIPILVFGFISHNLYSKSMYKNVATYSYEVIERIDKNMETYISDIENILQLRSDYYFQQYLKLNAAGDIDGNRKYTVRIWENFESMRKMKTDLVNIRLIANSGQTISCFGNYWEDVSLDPLYNELITKKSDDLSIQPPYVNIQNKNVFSIGKAINGDFMGGQGIMCIDIDVEFLNKICKDIKLGENGYVFLAEKAGNIIFLPKNSDKQRYSKEIAQNMAAQKSDSGSFIDKCHGTNYFVTYKTSEITGWRIIGVSSELEMTKDIKMANRIFYWLIPIIIIVILLLTIYLTTILTNPIRELRSLMKQASENDLSINANIRTRDEIGQLANSFNKMMNKIRGLMEKVVDDQLKIRKMEMKMMQELIKPHFIYNTLDSIIGLLEQKRNDDAMDLIDSLGKFFRTSLSHGREVVLVKEELDHVRSYLTIQQFRFSNKFDYLFEIDNEIYKYRTIKLVLQPLVENAIYHGIKNLDKKGLVVIKGYLKEDQIIFEILDNGEGLDEISIDHINRIVSGEEVVADENQYFGIRNVNERIKLNFGRDYGLKYESKVSIGTKVIANIPQVR